MRKRTAMDIGASVTRVVAPGNEEIFVFPTAVALDCLTNRAVEFGDQAVMQTKRLPGSANLFYPLYTPEHLNARMLEGIFSCAAAFVKDNGKFGSDLVISVGADLSEEQEEMFPIAASGCGAKDVYFIHPLHALSQVVDQAIGEPTLLCHVGASVTRIGIFVGGECKKEKTVAVGGRFFDDAVGDDIYERNGLLLDDEGAEKLKLALCDPDFDKEKIKASGIHHLTGLPITAELDCAVLRSVLVASYAHLTQAISELVEEYGEEVKAVTLSGGACQTFGLAEEIGKVLAQDARVQIAENPDQTVIQGLCAIIADQSME